VLEVWFAGCHCDIGGGSVPNGTRNSLARIPLRWMIRQCFLTKSGIQFHREAFKDIGIDPSTLFPFVITRPTALKATACAVAEAETPSHTAEATDATLTGSVQGSLTAASTFKAEEDEELADALTPIYDELKLSKIWWLLEIFPMRHRVQSRDNALWKFEWRVNMGHARRIPKAVRENKEKILVHRSVRTRMEAEGLEGGRYVPKAKFDQEDCKWVD